eukprot:TRINITY_DN24139_c0_g1_i1.p1 TRINITY_DN24139_c0_g1~~TRINITY_DN24139_c0_g1_i1.p1  ORF type:complete len:559 (-),score=105.17 TRINITY_DN24139_c0_g1_i1:125-1717(-)
MADAATVEARLLWPPSAGGSGGMSASQSSSSSSSARLKVQDLADGETQHGEREEHETDPSSATLLARLGFAVLRPALPEEDFVGNAEIARDLERGNIGTAMARLLHPEAALFQRLGLWWARCGEPRVKRSAPLGHVPGEDRLLSKVPLPAPVGLPLHVVGKILRQLPSFGRLLKVSLAVQAPVQATALRPYHDLATPAAPAAAAAAAGTCDAAAATDSSSSRACAATAPRSRPQQPWWWHSKLGAGDAIVLDEMRSQHSPIVLPGEEALHRARNPARMLRAALMADAGRGPPRQATKICSGLQDEVLEPDPYPVIGGRYMVQLEPSALLRRWESCESDVIGELKPGSVVTVLARGDEVGRAQIYTEHAMLMPGFISDGEDPSFTSATSGVDGWVQSALYNGTRLLHPLFNTPPTQVPTPAISKLLDDFGSTLRGICEWVNVTVGAAAAAPATEASAQHVEFVRNLHIEMLEKQLLASEQLSIEAQCVAVEVPSPRVLLVAGVMTASLVGGTCILVAMRLASAASPPYEMY